MEIIGPPPRWPGGDRCPHCDEPVVLTGPLRLISLHRDSHGRHCESSGRSLVHHRYRELLQVIFGVNHK